MSEVPSITSYLILGPTNSLRSGSFLLMLFSAVNASGDDKGLPEQFPSPEVIDLRFGYVSLQNGFDRNRLIRTPLVKSIFHLKKNVSRPI